MQALYLFLVAYKAWELKEMNFSSLKFRTSWYINLLRVKWGLFTFWKPTRINKIYVNFFFISSIFSCFLGKQTYPIKENTMTENYDTIRAYEREVPEDCFCRLDPYLVRIFSGLLSARDRERRAQISNHAQNESRVWAQDPRVTVYGMMMVKVIFGVKFYPKKKKLG